MKTQKYGPGARVAWLGGTLALGMLLGGCGGGASGGGNAHAFDSGLDGNRTRGELSQEERVRLCEDEQAYAFSHYDLQSYCLQRAKSAGLNEVQATADEGEFLPECTSSYDRCIAQGQEGLDSTVAQAAQGCAARTPEELRLGCGVTVAVYEDCWKRNMDLTLTRAATPCEGTSVADLEFPADFIADCVEPLEALCPGET